jgi:hypothetical protein
VPHHRELLAHLSVDLLGELFDSGARGLGVVQVNRRDDQDLVRRELQSEQIEYFVDARRPRGSAC